VNGKPSGRFVLRLPPESHAALKKLASQRGISLNELCLRALKAYLKRGRLIAGTDGKEEGHLLQALTDMLGESLLGVLLFGSVAREEYHDGSDIDLLVVVTSELPLTRRLYARWDERFAGNLHSPHFVHLPASIEEAGSIWFEAAVDGIVLHDSDGRVSRFLSQIRRAIAAGRLVRRFAYGYPYWIREDRGASGV
jgi:predicted nucleotidyltransferase